MSWVPRVTMKGWSDGDDGPDGQGAHVRPHLVGQVGGALEQGGRDAGGQAHDTTGAQVGAGENDTSGDTQSGGQVGGRL